MPQIPTYSDPKTINNLIDGNALKRVIKWVYDTYQQKGNYVTTSLLIQELGKITSFEFSVVDTIEGVTGKPGTIYLVSHDGDDPNKYDEYIYVNDNFELIGSKEINLSNYAEKTEVVKDVKIAGASQVDENREVNIPFASYIGKQGQNNPTPGIISADMINDLKGAKNSVRSISVNDELQEADDDNNVNIAVPTGEQLKRIKEVTSEADMVGLQDGSYREELYNHFVSNNTLVCDILRLTDMDSETIDIEVIGTFKDTSTSQSPILVVSIFDRLYTISSKKQTDLFGNFLTADDVQKFYVGTTDLTSSSQIQGSKDGDIYIKTN